MSFRLSARRGPDSKKIKVARTLFSSSSARPALARLAGQKAREQKTVGRQARQHQPRQHRRGPGQDMDRQTFLDRRTHQLEAGIGDQRRAGIADQDDARLPLQALASSRGRSRAAL